MERDPCVLSQTVLIIRMVHSHIFDASVHHTRDIALHTLQWVDQYAFVRLHQPHQRYTAGNRGWKIDREPAHLATLPEITRHLKETIVEAAVAESDIDLVKVGVDTQCVP